MFACKKKFWLNFFMFISLNFLAFSVRAEQFWMVVSHECNKKSQDFTVSFAGAWGDEGEKLPMLKKNSWNTQDLIDISTGKDGKYLIKRKSRQAICILNNHVYILKVVPELVPRYHPEGYCATRVGARLNIFHNEKIVASASTDGCRENGVVTTEIKLSPGLRTKYIKVPGEIFFGGH